MDRRLALGMLWMLAALSALAVFAIELIERAEPAIGRPTVTPAFSPNGDGARDEAALHFRLERRQTISVSIVDADGEVVRRLLRDERGGAVRLMWDGERDNGTRAAPGRYFLRVGLPEEDDVVDVPSPIRLDLTPPRIVRAAFDHSRLSTHEVVRADVEVHAASGYWLELDGTRLPTLRVRRDPQQPLKRRQREFLISATVPEPALVCATDTRVPRQCGLRGELAFVAVDRAGNRAVATDRAPTVRLVD